MEVISRKKAKEQGLAMYYTGKPCKRGHIDLRHTSQGTCASCRKEYNTSGIKKERDALYRKENKEAVAETKKRNYEENKEYVLSRNRNWQNENAEYIKNYRLIHQDVFRDRRRKYDKEVKEENGERYQRRLANKRNADSVRRARHSSTISKLYKEEILGIYLKSNQENEKLRKCVITDDYIKQEFCHVDHIIPLVNKNVSGLHVPWNMQILDSEINMQKHNSFTPYWENHLTGEVQYG